MIKAVYHRKYHTLTVEGHAHSAEPGQDLVCAAASAIAYTLAANAETLFAQGAVRKPEIRMEPGNTEIRCRSVSRFKATVTLVFDSVCLGLDILSQQYPENISYEIQD